MIYIGSDHRGFELCNYIEKFFQDSNIPYYRINEATEPCDYPDIAHNLVDRMGKDDVGILICFSANGMAMTANKYKNIRAAICWNRSVAQLARAHNDANVLCLPAGCLTFQSTLEILNAFLNAQFEGGRHKTRVDKIYNLHE